MDYATERHSLTFTPNDDGLTREVSCVKCGEVTNKTARHSLFDETDSLGYTWLACECGEVLVTECDGNKYTLLQKAIDAAAPAGDMRTLAQNVMENVVVTDDSYSW